jgi:transposase
MSALVIGLDPHKASNTIAVLDAEETLVARRRFENTADGLVAMLEAVSGWSDRIWAVEGANGIGRSVAQRLVAAGEMVVDVPAKLATRVRVYSTGHGTKTDDTDAVAIARAALHSRRLRMVRPDDENVALKLLSDRRHELVGSRTQSVCRLHRLLRELVPGGMPRHLTAERAEALVTGLEVSDPCFVDESRPGFGSHRGHETVRPANRRCHPEDPRCGESMTEHDEPRRWVKTAAYEAELVLHNGDAGPCRELWSRNERC